MQKTLIIVESPVKADKIQSFLDDSYVVLSSKGHITDLGKGGLFNTGVNVFNNFKPKYVLLEDKVKTFSVIFNEAEKAKEVLIAADGDREGEAIAWHIASRLSGIKAPIKRMVFNEIKKKTVLKAINNVGDININLFHSQETRRILDRLVGFMASPFLMRTMNQKLSAGRVQSVVTKMIVDREDEISSFISEDFWTINADLIHNSTIFNVKYSGRPVTQKETDSVVSKSESDFEVIKVIRETKKMAPPAPLVTSTLQRLMSKKFGISADRTMKAAQALYESGHCTYLRTDSVRCSDEALEEVRRYINDNHTLPTKPNEFKNKSASQDAHECIRPSDLDLKSDNDFILVDPDQKQVYDIIWKYFVASQMMPAVYDTLRVVLSPTNDKSIKYKALGKVLIDKGFLEVIGFEDKSSIDIPNLIVGDILKHKIIKSNKKQTQPPPRFSEDKLIGELESKNIGRPATYAELLSKISIRNYVEKNGAVFKPTNLGKEVTKKLDKYFNFMDYNYTADLESKLDKVEAGNLNKNDVLGLFFEKFNSELTQAYVDCGVELCSKCNSPMITMTNRKTQEQFLSCSNYKLCR